MQNPKPIKTPLHEGKDQYRSLTTEFSKLNSFIRKHPAIPEDLNPDHWAIYRLPDGDFLFHEIEEPHYFPIGAAYD